MKHNYDAVFFDFDGTVADTSAGIFGSADYAAKSLGLELPDEKGHRYFMGPPLSQSFNVIFGLTGDDIPLAIKKYREYYNGGGIFELEFYPGMLDFLSKLNSEGIKTAVTSSKPEMFVAKILEHFDISDKIDCIACPRSDSMPESKASLIGRALDGLKTDRSRALMVGDRYLDMEGAVNAGVDGCGALWGYGSEKELKDSGAKFIASQVCDLIPIVFSR